MDPDTKFLVALVSIIAPTLIVSLVMFSGSPDIADTIICRNLGLDKDAAACGKFLGLTDETKTINVVPRYAIR